MKRSRHRAMAWAVVVAVVAAGVGCGDDDRRTAADGDTPAPGPVAVADDGGPTETGADVPAVPPDGTSDGGVDLAALPPELRVLAEAVRSGAAASRVQAIEALEQLGGDAAAVLPELEAAMADGPAEVRIAAARALSVIRKAERDTSVELTPTDVAGTYTAGPIAVFTSVKWLVRPEAEPADPNDQSAALHASMHAMLAQPQPLPEDEAVARLRKMFAGATWRLSPHGGVRVTFADTAGLGITPPDAVAGMALTTGEGDDGPRPLEYAAARAKTSVADTVMYSVQAVVTKRTDAGLRLRVSVLISDGPHFANAEFGQELAPQPHPE